VLVCICHPTSDRDVEAIIDDGARTVAEIGQRCGAGTGCGACVERLCERLAARGSTDSQDTRDTGAASDCASDLVSIRSTR